MIIATLLKRSKRDYLTAIRVDAAAMGENTQPVTPYGLLYWGVTGWVFLVVPYGLLVVSSWTFGKAVLRCWARRAAPGRPGVSSSASWAKGLMLGGGHAISMEFVQRPMTW